MSNLCFRPYFFPFCRTEAALLPCNDKFPISLFRRSYHFFTFSPTLLSQSLKMFFPFLLLTETISITPKYLPYLSLIILSFLFHSYSSSDENQNFPFRNLQWFLPELFYFIFWNFSFSSMEFSISLSNFFYFTNRNFNLCLLPPTPCSDQSNISEFLLSAIENLKLEKETCFITFQEATNLFFYLLPLSIMDIRSAKNQLPCTLLWAIYIVLRTIYIM